MRRLIIILFLLTIQTAVFGQIPDKNISFYTANVELTFQPPLQKSFNSQHPLYKETPRINLTLNLFDNYVEYLKKINKISSRTRLHILYAPEIVSDELDDNLKLIKIHELGYNHILQKINEYLMLHKETDPAYLLDTAKALFEITKTSECKISDIANRVNLVNISADETCLEPDSDFCIINNQQIATLRPTIQNNKIYLFTNTENGYFSEILLNNSSEYFENISASSDGNYLAFTSNFTPTVIDLNTKKILSIFPENNNKIILSMEWAPNKPILAGMVLDKVTQERSIFIYDAKLGKNICGQKTKLPENQLYAHPYWAPNSSKIVFASVKGLHLVDLAKDRVVPNLIYTLGTITEVLWADEADAFAIVELIGQTRNHYEFDDLDFRKSILRKYNLNENNEASEDQAQKVESRNTIKLVSHTKNDRVIYLEGRLASKRLDRTLWDLSRVFKAYMTPFSTETLRREEQGRQISYEPTELALEYLYVFKNMNGKQNLVFDAGNNHSNHLYLDKQTNYWFIGLRDVNKLNEYENIYNHRSFPYPFSESNYFVFSSLEKAEILALTQFLEAYNLRHFKLLDNCAELMIIANFNGPMSIWRGKTRDIIKAQMP
jgi:WD40 repeat protein